MESERIKALEVQMKEILGNGQPGRMDKVEAEVKSHARLIWIGIGGLYAIQILPVLLKFLGKA